MNQEETPREGPLEQENPAQAAPAQEAAADKKAKKPHKEEEFLKKMKDCEAALEAQKEQFLRTAAEYSNYRARSERERSSIYADAAAATVKEFLPVADNFERALAQENASAEDLRKGLEMVQAQLHAALEKLGVTEMGAPGEPFNPEVHNAVSHVEDEARGEGEVSEVFQKGYRIGDKIIRHAMVVVAN